MVNDLHCQPQPTPSDHDRWRALVAIALASATVLLVQVAVTRILSVVVWYHFAFLSISLAMLALGAPGVWFTLRPPTERTLGRSLLVAAVGLPLTVFVICKLGVYMPHGSGMVFGVRSVLPMRVLLIVTVLLVPLLGLGAAVCQLLLRSPGRAVGTMYGADLLGATIGAAVVVPLMHLLPTPVLVALCGILPLVAAVVIRGVGVPLASGLGLAIVSLAVWDQPLTLRYAKYYEEPPDLLYERWTPTARLTVFPEPFFIPDPSQAFGWGLGDRYQSQPVEQLWLEQDGSAGTPITRLTGSPAELEHLAYDVTGVAYQIRALRSACVIGAGGGRDVLTALAAGVGKVDAVELNRHIIDALSGPFGDYSGDVYHLPGVTAVHNEGRSHLTRTDRIYDLIQISLIDSWAATAAGAFALSENHLYTREAFALYLQHLSPEGALSVSRWYIEPIPVESLRLVELTRTALADAGAADPERQMAVVLGSNILTVVAFASPLTAADRAALDRVVTERGFRRLWPDPDADHQASPVVQLLRDQWMPIPGLDLTAPTDDRPFFFHTASLLHPVDAEVQRRVTFNDHSVTLLRWLLLVVALLTVVLFFAPFVLVRGHQHAPGFWTGSLYFGCIGVAFLMVEAGWIQRFILYLGHPSYATTVVLAALLAGAGLGSLWSARVELAVIRRWSPLLVLVLAAVNLALGPLFAATLGAPAAIRVLLSLVALAAAGLPMGFAFPMGMVWFGEGNKAWFWAINGATGVLASVSSLALALVVGFSNVVFVGIAAYVAGTALLMSTRPVADPER